MSGAEQRERKKKQERLAAAKAVAAARNQGNDRRKIFIGIAIVAVLALAVIGGVIWAGAKGQEKVPIAAQTAGISAPVQREEGTVIIGDPNAKVTIDIYEDFLCPYCKQFNALYDDQIKREVEAKNLRVRSHMLTMLVNKSNPAGYSLDAANAALCAVDQDKYWQYYKSLFASQPREGRAGHTKAELIQLGRDVGITSEGFASCVNEGKYNAKAEAELPKASSLSFFEGTPTVASGDQPIDINNPNWLTNLINSAKAPSPNQ